MHTARAPLVVFLLALAGIGVSAGAQAGRSASAAMVARALTPADTIAARTIGDAAIAPDGTSVLFTVTRSTVTAQTNRVDVVLMLLRAGQTTPIELHVPACPVRQHSVPYSPSVSASAMRTSFASG